ncbi:hypothetical protein CEXT_269991 [Caerostris extrusa]|uniref:Uncharacterized protein n=1 Tax=Caerostris extrusa TaxID=172846 RepID=A0AAV4UDV3_CAEEX|nr:hypothetical protein CEXT_269991 [Caerostris extrusa]
MTPPGREMVIERTFLDSPSMVPGGRWTLASLMADIARGLNLSLYTDFDPGCARKINRIRILKCLLPPSHSGVFFRSCWGISSFLLREWEEDS